MKQVGKKIFLSTIASSLIFSPLMALPQGGKFTHGTSGTIITNGNSMSITGKTENGNHVIQWGGGFNIDKGQSVNFTTSGQNYLNIAYQKDASKIFGSLNGGTNNIYLINPMGVVIEKGGSVTANKFVASTTPLNDGQVSKFLSQGSKFSPVFDVNKKGNIVNLGTINANDILLIGNKVEINAGKISSNAKNNKSEIHLVGNSVYVDAAVVGKENDVMATIADKNGQAIAQQSINSFTNNGSLLPGNNLKFGDYGDVKNEAKSWTKYGSISDAAEWNLFAQYWNNNKNNFRNSFDNFRLIDDIDFKGQNTSIVGIDESSAFTKSFDGSGYSLKNVNINTNSQYVGLFGVVENSTIRNLSIDGLKITGNTNSAYIGGIVGKNKANSKTNFTNVTVNDIDIDIKGSNNKIGGIIGWGNGSNGAIKFENVALNKISVEGGEGSYVGGIGGQIDGGHFNNVILNDIEKIIAHGSSYGKAGGITGYSGSAAMMKDVYLFFNANSVLSADGTTYKAGLLVGQAGNVGTFDNVHVYYSNNQSGTVDESAVLGVEKIKYTNESTAKGKFHQKVTEQFKDVKYKDEKYAFADSFSKSIDASKLEKNDFDPAMLQHILDDIMNGHYAYDTKTGKWKIVGGNENNEIDQSVDFLNTFFANGAIGDEFFKLWKDDGSDSYNKFKAVYEVYTNKETIKKEKEDEVKNAQNNFNDAYSAYKNTLAALIERINDYNKLNEQGITDNLQSTYDSILANIKVLDQLYSNLMGSYDNLKDNVFVKNDIKEVGGYNGYSGSYEILGSVNLPIKGLLPTFDEPGKGGGGEDPTEPEVKPNIPKPDHNLVKIVYFEDEEKEEKEEAEIGEASADAGGIRCIVSDESKTMNVCITRKR
ncbi:filamentous hemagglutinin N-terminal domain-containing protein [Campylobacter sp. RKI_CA19_01128]|uniref:two-partner secretion domain-containing protein n=1 Tax=unclassified Campylobacter TaxID=2593542 RepID=UPI0021E882EB|nr:MULTISPECIES: filamentous hemagglutinin N-terminal domain-containing protein [unclassified Campylobacter]MCV3349624.1 filamentous hemagglutinin N-terminal domain-containing protein [Campylobacter sp. RKI_CA19_01127]MCV3355579.1 filamentous hemagglutinin N-terminal domain-containing protein [Campylobacter sp. RKI_CA19_01128]